MFHKILHASEFSQVPTDRMKWSRGP